jgi:N-acetylated-alpha-linked acidic dipeptidase
VEDHQLELKEKAVIYINSDGNGRGFIGASGSHTLEPFFNEITNDVVDPQTGVSIRQRHYAKMMVDADKATRTKSLGNSYMKLSALGAGSDYSPFLQHLGIAAMDLGFGGENPGGDYHSIYDSYDAFVRFKDPGFAYGIALSKTAGRVTLRMADADVLPFEFNSFYKTVNDYMGEVKTLLDNTRSETEMDNNLIRTGIYDLAKDPKKTYASPAVKSTVPYLDFSSLENAMNELRNAAEEFQHAYPNATSLSAEKQKALNEILFKAERSLVSEKGLPRRAWYKHTIYAPGYYTGYGVKTLPGIREGIEQRSWGEAQDNISEVAHAVNQYVIEIKKANAILK